MVEFTSRDEIEAWLKDRPREDAVVLAARAALRVAPLLVTALGRDVAERRATILLPCLRGLAVAWCASTWRSHRTELTTSAGATYAVYAAGYVADVTLAATAAGFTSPAARAAANASGAAYAAAFVDASVAASSAAHATADAADAHAAASAAYTARAAAYAIASIDATALKGGVPVPEIARRPLWPDGVPDWAAEHWQRLRAHLDAAPSNENWWVWTSWYQARLDGAPKPVEALELARVMIPDETWKQGPKAVNAGIARLIAEHSAEDAGGADDPPPAVDLDALLETPELRAALADFELDRLAMLMRMVPFADDLPDLDDPALLRDRQNRLSELADGAGDLARDIRDFGGNAPAWLRRELHRYDNEAGRDPEAVRPGRLWDLGLAIASGLTNPDVEHALPEHLFGKLERFVEKHLDLMRDYFASALARMRAVDRIELSESATPEAALDALAQTSAAIAENDWGELPAPDDETQAVIDDRVEELRDILHRIRITNDERRRADLERTYWRRFKTAAMTVFRLTWKTAAVTGGAGATSFGIATGMDHFFPETFWAAIQMLRQLFSNLPWPF